MINIFLKYQLKKLSELFVREKIFREYKDIRKVLLLFDIEDLLVVENFVATLNAEGKQVAAYSVDLKKNVYPQLSENFKIWDKQKLDRYGVPKKEDISLFKKETADVLIDLTNSSSLIQKYLFLNASVNYRVGFNRDNAMNYDMLIERNLDHDFSFFADQLLFYMKSLRSK